MENLFLYSFQIQLIHYNRSQLLLGLEFGWAVLGCCFVNWTALASFSKGSPLWMMMALLVPSPWVVGSL